MMGRATSQHTILVINHSLLIHGQGGLLDRASFKKIVYIINWKPLMGDPAEVGHEYLLAFL